MKLPHYIIYNSTLPAFFGRLFVRRPFAAWNFGFWTFVPGPTIDERLAVHEYVHVRQFAMGWMTGVVIWLLLSLIDPLSPYLLLLTPFTFSVAYVLASVIAVLTGGHAYRDNIFEREARSEAGEPL